MKTRQSGYLLPFSAIAAFILLTSAGFWYKQSVVLSRLENLLIERHNLYLECNSLIPILKNKLTHRTNSELMQMEKDFMAIEVGYIPRWKIDRLPWRENTVGFIFYLQQKHAVPVKLSIPYFGSAN